MDKRIRSPNYPALSLKQAIARTVLLYRNQHKHSAPREVLAKSLGFQSLSGAASTVISSLFKYGLLDRVGLEAKISERAMQIIHPTSEEERAQALRTAALEPQLFAELNERFPGELPSDDLLTNYLVRKNFSPSAVSGVIASYKETLEFVASEAGAYDSDVDMSEAESVMATSQAQMAEFAQRPPPVSTAKAGQPMIGIMEGGRLTVNATLNDRESVEELIAMLNAVKGIAPSRPPAEGSEETIPIRRAAE